VDNEEPTIQERIRAAARQREAGDIAGARALLVAVQDDADKSSAFDRLFFAHTFADVQPDLAGELEWDLTALSALEKLTGEEGAAEGVPGGKAGLLSSLHLNVADVQRRLGNEDEAQRHYIKGLHRPECAR